jgi:hypothetical protein
LEAVVVVVQIWVVVEEQVDILRVYLIYLLEHIRLQLVLEVLETTLALEHVVDGKEQTLL